MLQLYTTHHSDSYVFIYQRAFSKPNPDAELVAAGVDVLHLAILEKLASRCTLQLATTICFWHDVFNYLFEGKGTKINNYTMLEKGDFRRCAFPNEWDQLVDKLGDGVKIEFPVKFRLFISQGPKSHTMTAWEIKEFTSRSSVYTVSNKLSVLLSFFTVSLSFFLI